MNMLKIETNFEVKVMNFKGWVEIGEDKRGSGGRCIVDLK
jgi:hypothetical protein